MKLNTNIPEHTEKIARYLAGEMSTTELVQFEEQVESNPENEILINKMRNDWNRFGAESHKKPEVDKAWSNLHAKLEQENLIIKRAYTPIYKMQWVQVAAAVLLLFAVSSTILFSGLWSKNIIIHSSSDPSTLVHTLVDGSSVYLTPNTTLTYSKKFGSSNRNITLEGEAFFDVSSNPNLPFVIETSDASLRVLGTSFTVKSNKVDNFEVIVESGVVSVSSKVIAQQTIVANAGDRVTMVNNQLAKRTIQQTTPSWKKQRIQFKDETLANIIFVINRNFNANIILDSQGLESRVLTVTFHNNSINSMVEVICATLGLEPLYVDNTIIISPKK